jgi:signal transduction histidine kinase
MECSGDAVESAAIIQQETERIERFIQDLLNYAGESNPQRELTDVIALLQQVTERLRPLVETHGIDLSFDVPSDLSPVNIDVEQMEQALMNLCINAVQALDGPGHIHLSAVCEDGQILSISVADNGPGIALDDRVRIFAPFYTTKDSGTGMGLSVVQRIVENHGGRIAVESEPGHGATFLIYLPLCLTG